MQELIRRIKIENDSKKLSVLLDELEFRIEPILIRQKALQSILLVIHYLLYFVVLIHTFHSFKIETRFDVFFNSIHILKFQGVARTLVWFTAYIFIPHIVAKLILPLLKLVNKKNDNFVPTYTIQKILIF